MTEAQGGSDLRRTETVAEDNRDGTFSLHGRKWFFSVPHSDLFLTLARTTEGISCFVVPGWLSDGRRNGVAIQRLKDKCGNRSNASSEVEFHGAIGHLLGEPGRGLRTGLAMTTTAGWTSRRPPPGRCGRRCLWPRITPCIAMPSSVR
jgi:putative acyl-CoA dehydrogenase